MLKTSISDTNTISQRFMPLTSGVFNRGGHLAMPPTDVDQWNLCKFCYFSDVRCHKICYSFWGTLFPRPPTGAPPLDPAGGLPSPRLRDLGTPFLNSKYATAIDWCELHQWLSTAAHVTCQSSTASVRWHRGSSSEHWCIVYHIL